MIDIGDRVVCLYNGTTVKGIVIKIYYPTACAKQIMVKCNDGRKFHAPATCWSKY